jgi:predicted nucleic acid-binding protein
MRVLIDTNVLLRLSDPDHPFHSEVKIAIRLLDQSGHSPVLVPQVLYEYWVVATRPLANNGFGLNPKTVDELLTDWVQNFRLLMDERGVFTHWRDLVSRHEVKGKSAHDTRLVAAMVRHGVSRLLTYNKADFIRFSNIEVISPADVMAAPS